MEGIITFISPCILPMIPVFVSYFAGREGDGSSRRTIISALGFVLGFTLVFTALGAFAGQLGGFLKNYQKVLNIAGGLILILLGLNFTGLIRIPFFNNAAGLSTKDGKNGFISSMVFGMAFSVSWTPCVGTFLGSALMMAAVSGNTLSGIAMLLVYSLGLGIPFLLSALLIEKLKTAFAAIKRHYKTITLVSGVLLIILGIAIATGLMDYFYLLI